MDAVDPFYAHIGPVRDVIRELTEQGRATRERWNAKPDAESQGMAEYAVEADYLGVWGEQPVVTTVTSAGFLLFAAEDHLRSMAAMFDSDPAPVFGHLVLARAALEAAARARWLLVGSIGVRGRVSRGLANRAQDLENQIKFGVRDETWDPVAKLSELQSAAEAGGFARRSKKDNVVLHEEVPGYRTLVSDLFQGTPFGGDGLPSLLYSYFSSVVHGQQFGLMQSTDRGGVEPHPLHGTVGLKVHTSSQGVVSAFAIAGAGYLFAVEEQNTLMGWDNEAWRVARTRALAAMKEALPDRPT